MNRGLKPYTKQLTQQVGNAGAISVNVNPNDANMHMTLPLIKTVGPFPIELGLIYNHQDKNTSDSMFGKGFRLNLFSKIKVDGSEIKMLNADGSTDTYTDGVVNQETQKTVAVNKDDYQVLQGYVVTDQQGNEVRYRLTNLDYPYALSTKSGKTITIDFIASTPTIQNDKGDKIELIKTNSRVSQVLYTYNGTEIFSVKLQYTNDRITSLSYTQLAKTSLQNKTSIEYGGDYIILKDDISLHRVKVTFDSSNRVVKVSDMFDDESKARSTTISYSGKKTTITDFLGRKMYRVFDESDMLRYEMDSEGNVVETVFDTESKSILAQSQPIATKNKLPSLFPSDYLAIYSSSGVTVTTEQCLEEYVGNSVSRVRGTGYVRYNVECEGLSTDTITAILWGKLTKGSVSVTLLTDKRASRTFSKAGDCFDIVTLGRNAEKSFSSIQIEIGFVDAEIVIGGIQVLKKNFGAFFQYDSNGNATKTGNLGTAEISYGANNLPSQSIGIDSTLISYDYDEKNNLEKATMAYGVTVKNTYDEDNNLIQTKISNKDGFVLSTEKTYQDARFVSSETDELGNKTTMEYFDNGNLKKVTDAMNVVSELTYQDNGLLQKILTKKEGTSYDTESVSAQYTYTSKNLLETVTLENGSVYQFVYDSRNRLTQVKLNSLSVFLFEYDDTTGNVTKQMYGSGDCFFFEYNSDGQVSAVKYKAAGSSTAAVRYSYLYNAKKQLEKVTDKNGKVLRQYEYDSDGRVFKLSNSDFAISQQYDNLGNVNAITSTIKGKTINQSFDTIQRSKGAHPKSLLAPFAKDNYLALFEENGNLVRSTGGFAPINEPTLTKDGIIPCARITPNNLLQYVLTDVPKTHPLESGCVQFWFKMDKVGTSSQLLCNQSVTTECVIQAYVEYRKINLVVVDSQRKITQLLTTKNSVVEGWNFFALNFMNRNDGQGYDDVCEYSVTLNDETITSIVKNPRIDVSFGASPIYYIGNYPGNGFEMTGHIAALLISPRKYLSPNEIQKYYRTTKEYIIDNQSIDDKTVDFSQTTLYTIDKDLQDRWDILPLHSSVTSLKGTKPVAFDLRNVSETDKDRTFNFNQKINRYAYVADGSVLQYRFGQDSVGTIVMRAFTDTTAEKQYLFEGVDESNKTIGLYRGSDSYLWVDNNGNQIKTNFEFTTNQWHTVGLSFQSEIQYSDSGIPSAIDQMRVFLDNSAADVNANYVSYTDLKISVGRKTNSKTLASNFGAYSESYPLHGQIEMVAVNKAYNELSTLQTLASELVCVTKSTQYDELGMLKQTEIHKAGTRVLSHDYSYTSRADVTDITNPQTLAVMSKYISKRVKQETIGTNDRSTERKYQWDACGRVTKITDATFGGHTYIYDYRGFLIQADNERFSYDKNGNILWHNYTEFKYGETIKDRLEEVDREKITYNAVSSLNPASWNGRYYTYEGRRLSTFTKDKIKTTYTYDDQGLRTHKSVAGKRGITYYYTGTKLVTEIRVPSRTNLEEYVKGNVRLDYLYDENGQLYGFIKNNAEKHYYIKDILGTILGIVDANGNLEAKYSYSAFGECTITFDSTGIGADNPFRFKGYYYDIESGMYYCHTRYFVPEWGRWLTAADPTNLDFTHPTGINLFAFCNNSATNPQRPRINCDLNYVSSIGIPSKVVSDNQSNADLKISSLNDFISFSMIYDAEISVYSEYHLLYNYEIGIGYSKSFDTGKAINFYSQSSQNPLMFWKSSVGIDINVNGWGLGIGFGSEMSVAIHLKGTSIDIHSNNIGRIGIKIAQETGKGVYNYSKIELHGIWLMIAVLAPESFPSLLPILVPSLR